jgi:hypothetical protein
MWQLPTAHDDYSHTDSDCTTAVQNGKTGKTPSMWEDTKHVELPLQPSSASELCMQQLPTAVKCISCISAYSRHGCALCALSRNVLSNIPVAVGAVIPAGAFLALQLQASQDSIRHNSTGP